MVKYRIEMICKRVEIDVTYRYCAKECGSTQKRKMEAS